MREDPQADRGARRVQRRQARLAERVRELVSEIILFKLKDPRVGFVTVIDASVTVDVKEATIRLSVLGTESAQRTALRALASSRGFIQRELAKGLQTRNTPQLHFELDERSAKAAALDATFERIRRERQERADHTAGE